MHEQIGHDDFFKCGLKGIDELVRQFSDETNRVAEKGILISRKSQSSCGGIQRGKKFIFTQYFGSCKCIQQRGFSRVGVSGQGDDKFSRSIFDRHLVAALDVLEVSDHLLNPAPDQPLVGLELFFARTAHADSAFVA